LLVGVLSFNSRILGREKMDTFQTKKLMTVLGLLMYGKW